MRFAAVAAAVGLGLLLDHGIAAGPAEPGGDAAATHVPASSPAPSDAAAKHVHRTACLREARKKKLLGAEKSAFLKSCIGVPG